MQVDRGDISTARKGTHPYPFQDVKRTIPAPAFYGRSRRTSSPPLRPRRSPIAEIACSPTFESGPGVIQPILPSTPLRNPQLGKGDVSAPLVASLQSTTYHPSPRTPGVSVNEISPSPFHRERSHGPVEPLLSPPQSLNSDPQPRLEQPVPSPPFVPDDDDSFEYTAKPLSDESDVSASDEDYHPPVRKVRQPSLGDDLIVMSPEISPRAAALTAAAKGKQKATDFDDPPGDGPPAVPTRGRIRNATVDEFRALGARTKQEAQRLADLHGVNLATVMRYAGLGAGREVGLQATVTHLKQFMRLRPSQRLEVR